VVFCVHGLYAVVCAGIYTDAAISIKSWPRRGQAGKSAQKESFSSMSFFFNVEVFFEKMAR